MKQHKSNLGDYLVTLRRTKSRWLSVLMGLFVISVAVAFGLPPVYRSSATILIEQQEIPQELVRSTVTSFADQRIQVISQRVMTRANLLEIMRKYDLYKKEQRKDPLEVVLDDMREDIEMKTVSAEVVDPRSGRPTVATIAFILTYYNESPALAQKVANELASLYLNENLTSRRQQATEAADFLKDEAEKLRNKITDLEQKLADFKEKNVNRLPELTQLNFQLLDRIETQLLEVERQIRAVEERKIYLTSELAQINPNSTLYSETGERVLGPADRLKSLQANFISMSAVYAPDHPDLVKIKKQIASLEQQTGGSDIQKQLMNKKVAKETELSLAKKAYSEDHPTIKQLQGSIAKLDEELSKPAVIELGEGNEIKPDNNVYIRLQGELEAAEADSRALEIKEAELQSKKQVYESHLTNTPQVEREYSSLMRDYENASVKYKEINAKQMEAQLAEVLEVERKGERFTLIEPPQLPEEPDKPNRLAVVFLGAVFSVVGGAGSVVVSHSLDETVRGAQGVQALLGAAPLATIPTMRNDEELHRKRRRMWWWIIFLLVLICAAVAAFHWLIMPLDILWYGGLQRLGI